MSTQSKAPKAATRKPQRKRFTVEEANRALPYVSRIVADIREVFRHALSLQQQLERLRTGENGDAIRREYEKAAAELRRYAEELSGVGVELKDYETGLLDFPAVFEGRDIYLCWKSGEEKVEAWHELDAGFAGRRDVALLSVAGKE